MYSSSFSWLNMLPGLPATCYICTYIILDTTKHICHFEQNNFCPETGAASQHRKRHTVTLRQSRRECGHSSREGSIDRVGSRLRRGLLVIGRNVHERGSEGGRLGLQALERGQDDGGYAQGLEVGLAVGQGSQGSLDVRGEGARDICDDGLRVRARGLGLI